MGFHGQQSFTAATGTLTCIKTSTPEYDENVERMNYIHCKTGRRTRRNKEIPVLKA